jgi:hypothetical protein
MKIPYGTTIYVGSRRYRAGDELPDDVARGVGLLADPPAPKIEIIQPVFQPVISVKLQGKKSKNGFESANRRGFSSHS